MRRFFIDPTTIKNNYGTLTDQEARHINTVLRLKPGCAIELFDGKGMVYQAEISRLNKTAVEAKILASQHQLESPPFLCVAQSLVKGNKMDLIIQKATELGVTALLPVISQHCAVQSTSTSQISRWQRIALESCKQCGRPTPLQCQATLPLPQLLAQSAEFSTKIILWENEATTMLNNLPSLHSVERVLLLIGPEGGFSAQEAASAISQGFMPVSLGRRTLRAETAALAAMAIFQFLLGNLKRN